MSTSTVGNRFGFHGLPVDQETGLLYARNRHYDPDLGRFISVDSLGYVDGPNLYQYALNNPVSFADPMGLCAGCEFLREMGGGVLEEGAEFAHGLWHVATHPRETLQGAGTFVSDVLANPGQMAEGMIDSGADFLGRLASPDPEVVGNALSGVAFDALLTVTTGGASKTLSMVGRGGRRARQGLAMRHARRGDGHTARSARRTTRRSDGVESGGSSGEAATLEHGRRSAGSAPWEAYLPEARRRVAESRARQGGIEAFGLADVPRGTGGGRTFFHGTSVDSALSLLNGANLDAGRAVALKIDGGPGFFMATRIDDAYFFAARREGTIIQIEMTYAAINDLRKAGAMDRPIPQGLAPVPFAGDEFVVPPSAFDTFNRLRKFGEINITPAKF